MAFAYRFRPRYVDCDAQRVMHNAQYLAYVDDAVDCFVRSRLGDFESLGFDFMLKKTTLEWQSPAVMHEWVDVEVRVVRWGTTSFDVQCVASAAGRPVFTCVGVNVSTTPGAPVPVPIPPAVKDALVE